MTPKQMNISLYDKIRVLLVAPTPPPNGGISRWSCLLLEWLGQRKDINLRHVDSAPHWRATYDQNRLKRLVGGGLQGLRDGWRILACILRFHPQVIHLTSSAGLATLRDLTVNSLARLLGVRSVYHIHMGRLPELAANRNWEWRMLALAMRMADKVVVLDSASQKVLELVLPPGKVNLVPNGINLRCPEELPEKGSVGQPIVVPTRLATLANSDGDLKVVLFLGWVVPTKGCRELIEAWCQVRQSGWELRIAGPVSQDYQNDLLTILGEDSSVRFTGALSFDEAAVQMHRADVFALPTYTEGFPFVILEAMAAS